MSCLVIETSFSRNRRCSNSTRALKISDHRLILWQRRNSCVAKFLSRTSGSELALQFPSVCELEDGSYLKAQPPGFNGHVRTVQRPRQSPPVSSSQMANSNSLSPGPSPRHGRLQCRVVGLEVKSQPTCHPATRFAFCVLLFSPRLTIAIDSSTGGTCKKSSPVSFSVHCK